jgi:sec-independent protein translocase protein TatA
MFAGLTGWHLLIIVGVVVLLFGATKLPALAKSVGQSMRIFKDEVHELKKDGDTADVTVAPGDTGPRTTN